MAAACSLMPQRNVLCYCTMVLAILLEVFLSIPFALAPCVIVAAAVQAFNLAESVRVFNGTVSFLALYTTSAVMNIRDINEWAVLNAAFLVSMHRAVL